MKTITVAQLRQNPTDAIASVEAGESYVVTRHRHPVAQLIPADDDAVVRVVPARNPAPTNLSARRPWRLKTAATVDVLLADMRSDR
jgi:prevent-host-death family protein